MILYTVCFISSVTLFVAEKSSRKSKTKTKKKGRIIHVCRETIKHWHVRDEIWELNPHRCTFSVPEAREHVFSVPKPQGPLK